MSLRDEVRMALAPVAFEHVAVTKVDYHGLSGDAVTVRVRTGDGLRDVTMFVADQNRLKDEEKAALVSKKVKSLLEGTAE